jgi:hypothetical protein
LEPFTLGVEEPLFVILTNENKKYDKNNKKCKRKREREKEKNFNHNLSF